ncbi:hypothetical protein HHL24_02915 [Paraburkholderia sp. RP-4-7]|uniref:Uncharacterized protein n=1 Tax=Paraburkholderia polaris TaxID=2728848 RepID=A0A848I9W9_9BURK|nr:hypothetical protein [Paraburkholderia polaris]NML96914.1 hypothetical protein [Paraburkholderia polaris]
MPLKIRHCAAVLTAVLQIPCFAQTEIPISPTLVYPKSNNAVGRLSLRAGDWPVNSQAANCRSGWVDVRLNPTGPNIISRGVNFIGGVPPSETVTYADVRVVAGEVAAVKLVEPDKMFIPPLHENFINLAWSSWGECGAVAKGIRERVVGGKTVQVSGTMILESPVPYWMVNSNPYVNVVNAVPSGDAHEKPSSTWGYSRMIFFPDLGGVPSSAILMKIAPRTASWIDRDLD